MTEIRSEAIPNRSLLLDDRKLFARIWEKLSKRQQIRIAMTAEVTAVDFDSMDQQSYYRVVDMYYSELLRAYQMVMSAAYAHVPPSKIDLPKVG